MDALKLCCPHCGCQIGGNTPGATMFAMVHLKVKAYEPGELVALPTPAQRAELLADVVAAAAAPEDLDAGSRTSTPAPPLLPKDRPPTPEELAAYAAGGGGELPPAPPAPSPAETEASPPPSTTAPSAPAAIWQAACRRCRKPITYRAGDAKPETCERCSP